MTAPNSKPPGAGGGSVATRGLLVQTLVALLDVAQTESSFTEITLEPAVGNEQFDFLWKNKDGSHATQVKSTINSFTKADVEKWAGELESARSTEHCRLMLVGNIPPGLVGLISVGAVVIETKNLHLDDLVEQAAHRLAAFLEGEKQPSGTAAERVMVVHALTSKLQHLASSSERFSREEFIKLLTRWVKEAPRQGRPIDISRIVKYAPAELIGREAETQLLNDAWAKVRDAEKKRPHILTFVALGGEGKTSLVAKWAAELAHQDWPGCDTVFAWSFYSQGTRDQTAISSDTFLAEALTFFGDAAMAGSAQGAFDKGRRLALLVGERRALLILDGVEPLQYAPTSPTPGELKDQGLAALLKGLAATNHGLCVATTRYAIADLRAYWQTTAPMHELPRLSTAAGVRLLRAIGVKTGSPAEFQKLVEDVDGHALTLQILGQFLVRAFHGDIRCRDRVKFEKADAKIHGGHAFRAMEAYVKWLENDSEEARREVALLKLLGLFDRPATVDCVNALRQAPAIPGLTEPLLGLAEDDWEFSLTSLRDAKLLTVSRAESSGELIALDAHPLLREYFAVRLRNGSFWPSFFRKMLHRIIPRLSAASPAWRAAHRRLYEHLKNSTKDALTIRPTLEDLQPLYQAVAHGCQAGLYQVAYDEVYISRICRATKAGDMDYSRRYLGAFGADLEALSSFFAQRWDVPSPFIGKASHTFLLSRAALDLRALGRTTEAIELTRVYLQRDIDNKDWRNAAIASINLCELVLPVGDVAGAIRNAEQSIIYGERGGTAFERLVSLATLADALHQAGRPADAMAGFLEAERMQARFEVSWPLLYSLRGSQYCDLLLAKPERAAWHAFGMAGYPQNAAPRHDEDILPHLQRCREVEQRAEEIIKWTVGIELVNLLDFGLDHLTLARAALYRIILQGSETREAKSEIAQAVDGLRRSGYAEQVPRGYLTCAWLRSLTGASTGAESAQSDLDEAWEIAERGPMKLHMADIHLYRARLFGTQNAPEKYPWESPAADLAAAEKLINDCGYHRRDEELADAKRAILGA